MATLTPLHYSTQHFAHLPPTICYAVGIDGGGTSTRARVVHRSGQVVGEGQAGASGLMQGVNQAWHNIELAIASALGANASLAANTCTQDNCALGVGLAGANIATWRDAFTAADPGYARLTVETDAMVALSGVHGNAPGALVIAGTGAAALALIDNGNVRHVGGWGFPSGDEGSGADLGRQAVQLTQRALDGRGPSGALTDAVLAMAGGSRTNLLTWCSTANQFDYAKLAPLVFQHANHDDAAHRLLAYAVDRLSDMAFAIDPQHTLPLVFAGGIATRLQNQLPATLQTRIVTPCGDAMDGALALCFR